MNWQPKVGFADGLRMTVSQSADATREIAAADYPGIRVLTAGRTSALDPQEVAYVQAIAKEFSPAELHGWFDELSKLSVPDAVTRIRGLLAGKNGGAS